VQLREKEATMTSKPNPGRGERITVRNINVPGHTSTVDATLYRAMLTALLKALPAQAPGLTQAEMIEAVQQHLPQDLFPGGAKSGWWVKCVQLDQEAGGGIVREPCKPLRWHKTGDKG
jgi:hypothetical protein